MAKQIKSFSGFSTKIYPMYSIITPQLGTTFEVRCAKTKEISMIKESLLLQNRIAEVVSSCLWNSIISCPDFINNEDDFLNYTTTKDRDAIIYGLYYITYGHERPYSLTCSECGFEETVRIDLDKSFSINMFPGAQAVIQGYKIEKIINKALKDKEIEKEIKKRDNILKPPPEMPEDLAREQFPEYFLMKDKENELGLDNIQENIFNGYNPILDPNSLINIRIPVKLPTSKNIVVYIKSPTLRDELDISKSMSLVKNSTMELVTECIFIDKIIEYDLENPNKIIQEITEKVSILEAYGDLEKEDRNELIEQYRNNFGKYGIKVEAKWQCKNKECKKENIVIIDPTTEFFRAISRST